MASVTLSSKGWIVIPAELRRKYGLEAGDELRVVDYGGILAVVPAAVDPVGEFAGILQGKASLVQELLKERKLERKRESVHKGKK